MGRASAAKAARVDVRLDRDDALLTDDQRELVAYAKDAIHILDESHIFVGILDGSDDAATARFMIQLGYSVLHDKVIIIPVPFGMRLPTKLERIADKIVRYDPARMASLSENLAVVLTELGVNVQ